MKRENSSTQLHVIHLLYHFQFPLFDSERLVSKSQVTPTLCKGCVVICTAPSARYQVLLRLSSQPWHLRHALQHWCSLANDDPFPQSLPELILLRLRCRWW